MDEEATDGPALEADVADASSAAWDPAPTSIWEVTSHIDPMTDVPRSTATAFLEGEVFDVEVTIVCASTERLGYQFRSFDKVGEPAKMKPDVIAGSLKNRLLLRLDRKQPRVVWDLSSRYSNEMRLDSVMSKRVGQAKDVVVRMPLLNGVETFTIDQSDAELQKVLRPCSGQAAPSPELQAVKPVEVGTHSALPMSTTQNDQCWTPPSGPNVIVRDSLRWDEVAEIETVTGRPYREGDSVLGKVEDRCPA